MKLVRVHLTVLGAVVLASAAAILFYRPSPARENGPALAEGRQVYTVVSGGSGPQITQIAIDPFDPMQGEAQTMELTVRYQQPVTRARVIVKTDHAETPHDFTPAGPLESGGALYRASWTTADTHDRVYGATVTVEAGAASSSVELTLR